MNTPWSKADHVETIEKGVHWVSTPSHGGLMVSLAKAKQVLSPDAIRVAYPGEFCGYVCFEEDCSFAVAFYEHPEWARFLDVKSLAEWKQSSYAPDSYMGKAALESIPRLTARVSMTDEQIKADMEQVIRRWNPEYFDASLAQKASL